eukprot:PhF_6_TR25332/c0_g1_i2/m.35015
MANQQKVYFLFLSLVCCGVFVWHIHAYKYNEIDAPPPQPSPPTTTTTTTTTTTRLSPRTVTPPPSPPPRKHAAVLDVSTMCSSFEHRVQKWKEDTATTPLIVQVRSKRSDHNGYGSLFKGVITSFILAMYSNRKFELVSEAPYFSTLWDSPYIHSDDVVRQKLTIPPDHLLHCGDWMKQLKANSIDQMHTTLEFLFDKSKPLVASMCDRSVFHRMIHDVRLAPFLKEFGFSTSVMTPHEMYGCVFRHIFPNPTKELQKNVDDTLAFAASGPLLGVQVRRGGRSVPWKDPSRIARNQANSATECVKQYIKEYLDTTPGSKYFLTTDAPAIYKKIIESFPATSRLKYKENVFYHTSLSRVTSETDRKEFDMKIAVDHLLLSKATKLFVTRSGFSETASWMAFARNRTEFVQSVCLKEIVTDCATSDC